MGLRYLNGYTYFFTEKGLIPNLLAFAREELELRSSTKPC
jgi:hypothetical protein